MKRISKQIQDEALFVGNDLHKRRWHATIRTVGVEFFSSSISGRWVELHRLLCRYKGCLIHAVYEAGYFGFWLFDHLTASKIKRYVEEKRNVTYKVLKRVCVENFGCKSETSGSIGASVRMLEIDETVFRGLLASLSTVLTCSLIRGC